MKLPYRSLTRYALLAALWLLALEGRAQTTCPAPQNLSVSALTATAATVTFQLPAGTSNTCSVTVSYGYVGGPTTTIPALGTGTRLSNLVPNQRYSLSVTRRCSTGGISGCSVPAVPTAYTSFTTPSALAAQAAAEAGDPALAPNPAQAGFTTLTLASPLPQPTSVVVLDALGRVARQQTVPAAAASAPLNLAGLAAGVYVVRCGSTAHRLVVE